MVVASVVSQFYRMILYGILMTIYDRLKPYEFKTHGCIDGLVAVANFTVCIS